MQKLWRCKFNKWSHNLNYMRNMKLFFQNILVNNRIVVKCMVCPDIELCPDCFAGRADIGIHHPSHAYKLIDNSGFTLFKTDWTAK